MTSHQQSAINKYLRTLKSTEWIKEELYKFEFANYIYSNIDWNTQNDDNILKILLQSQQNRYTESPIKGIQFIVKSGRIDYNHIISLEDVKLFRLFNEKRTLDSIDWSNRSMSFTSLSAWLSSLFPEIIFPAPLKGYDKTINYFFGLNDKFPKIDLKYIIACQKYMDESLELLMKFPIEQLFIDQWNKHSVLNSKLKFETKTELNQVDKVWIAQDFHLFVLRNILKIHSSSGKKNPKPKTQEDFEPTAIEGNTVLAKHMRYERNSTLIKKVKERAINNNPMLNCEVCGFSFKEQYGDIGIGFIEAHHKSPLHLAKGPKTTRIIDIALVCSNCHRMLHKGEPFCHDVEYLKSLISINHNGN
ncbi:HNH endonuclease [Saccharicrinis sp. FJH54]|uniref:HNH endonuclease n=1 Tax=Saccharicrinis sp. FJH54 TaxID=3344665 RepID=UPI0035D482EE